MRTSKKYLRFVRWPIPDLQRSTERHLKTRLDMLRWRHCICFGRQCLSRFCTWNLPMKSISLGADMEHILRNNSWTLAVQTWLCSFACQPKCRFTTYFPLGFLLERNIWIIWNHFLACKFGKTDLCLHYFNMTLRWLFNDQFKMRICSWCLYDSLPGPTFSYTEQKTIVKSSCCCNMFFLRLSKTLHD